MASLNNWNITGNLTRDPELREFQDGKQVCNFRLAVNGYREDDTQYVDVAVWGRSATACNQHLAKGSSVAAAGRARLRTYQKADGTPGATLELSAQDVVFLGRPAQKQEAPQEDQVDF